MMLARRDQENQLHAVQGIGVGKPLNTGLKGLAPKTPGNANTPAAPKNRAPLGAKTSNAKATAFKTPGLLNGATGLHKTQRRSGSVRRPKLKIQPDTVATEPEPNVDENEEPEIEYCPPKIKELPYASDDELFPEGAEIPTIKISDLSKGWYDDDSDQDGIGRFEREERENGEFLDAHCDRVLFESLEQSVDPEDWTPELNSMKSEALQREASFYEKHPSRRLAKPNTDPEKKMPPKAGPSMMSARSAVQALSTKPQPHFAAPTAAVTAKKSSAFEENAPIKRDPPNIASRSTIGYSKGRKVASNLRGNKGRSSAGRSKAVESRERDLIDQEQQDIIRQLTAAIEEDEDDTPLFGEKDAVGNWFEKQMGGFRLNLPDFDEPEDT